MHVWVFYSIYFTGISFLHSDTVFFDLNIHLLTHSALEICVENAV